MTRPAKTLLAASIALCSLLSGCAGPPDQAGPILAPAPVVLAVELCPGPPAPVLPQFYAAQPFDSAANIQILLERDDLYRQYIKGLCAAIDCYEAQIK